METNLKAFMKDELKDRGTMEFDGIERFKDADGKPIPFIIKRLSAKQVRDIRNLYRTSRVFKEKKSGGRPMVQNGQIVMEKDYNAEKAGLHIMVDAFVQPKLDDPKLMEFYGILDRLDMPETIFADMDEFQYANDCVLIACGLKEAEDEQEKTEKIKN